VRVLFGDVESVPSAAPDSAAPDSAAGAAPAAGATNGRA